MYKLLIKYPTRERPEQFAKTIKIYDSLLDEPEDALFLLTFDVDDLSYIKDEPAKAVVDCRAAAIPTSNSGRGKIAAINSGMDKAGEWDIVLLASDDMIPQVQGYDNLIREAFGDNLDQCLWIHDGRQVNICTIVCMGRAYYDRFGYLYHPSYKSLWADNEQTDVAVLGTKMKHCPCWIKNESPDWGGDQKVDRLYKKNNSYYKVDERNYRKRKLHGFPR